ncbi:MAG: T9SS type A sorting domain-containing protein, partial [Bacteroidetes bacterium]|nr:T9SS type A sorting domain-containing protein [Bacteroidota bacterium]
QPGSASMLWLPSDEPSNRHSDGSGIAWAARRRSSPSVGVQELPNLEGVSIFPSPTNGPLEVRMDTPGKTTVEVFNALGKLVNTTRFNGTSTKVDLTGNSAGIYTVRVSDGARYNVQRIALN